MARLRVLMLAAFAGAWLAAPACAATGMRTVCTITVNSSDEKEIFRRHLPRSGYRFVELVERGRPDWLASACRGNVRCDVLIVSGHFDGANGFFSDRLESREFLPVDELERVSCSDSCPTLFSHLAEVHLYGCNTLNPASLINSTAEVVRSLVREGHSIGEAERRFRALNSLHGQSSRDRMRQVFKDVPVIYGFSSVAPLGPIAASALQAYFRSSGPREIGQGRVSTRLLAQFSPFSMTSTRGMTDRDPLIGVRRDVCQFTDDRLSEAQRGEFVHRLLQREMAQARVHLDRIERYAAMLGRPEDRSVALRESLTRIASDADTRSRFLDFARDADQPVVRARMLGLARDLGWLTNDERRDELARMLDQVLARGLVVQADVDLACTLNQDQALDASVGGERIPDDVPHAAVRACLGDGQGRTRVLAALVGPSAADVRVAQVFLRHRPITDPQELRRVAQAIGRMPPSDAQVRALETLGRHYVADREILESLIRLYAGTPSSAVQAAIAGILIRADRGAIAGATLERVLRVSRRPAPPGETLVDALIRRLRPDPQAAPGSPEPARQMGRWPAVAPSRADR